MKTILIALIAEELEDQRFMLRRLLELNRYRVVHAVNGQEAVEVVRRERPDLILMSLTLPPLNGFYATRRIREYPEFRDVPVVAVSADDTPYFRAAARVAGYSAFITKPVDLDIMQDILNRLCSIKVRCAPKGCTS